jgi:PAS domain-containing protein
MHHSMPARKKQQRRSPLPRGNVNGEFLRPRLKRPRQPQRAAYKELEVILMRQLADCLAMPIFIVDAQGTLLFYNEPAEVLLGQRFDETGALTTRQWATAFVPTDLQNRPLPPEKVPLVIALRERRPNYAELRIRGLDQIERDIQASAFPLVGRTGRFLGAVAIFWEAPKP